MTSVTESNRAIVTGIMEALSRGERQPFADAMAEDFTWHTMGTTAWSGTFTGKTKVRQELIAPLFTQFGSHYTNTPTRILADGEFVVVESRGNVMTKTGKPYCNTYCMIIRMRDGKMVELTEHLDTALVSAVLVPPPWAKNA